MRAETIAFGLLLAVIPAFAAEPLAGNWRLDTQEINGEKTASPPLILQISESGGQLAFAFSAPVNREYVVSMSYTLRLDGSAADIRNAKGEKIGTIQMTSAGRSQYKLIMKGPDRPDGTGKLTVSPDGKTLTSESEAIQAGRVVHSRQLFLRN
jgi:hypothetical protein